MGPALVIAPVLDRLDDTVTPTEISDTAAASPAPSPRPAAHTRRDNFPIEGLGALTPTDWRLRSNAVSKRARSMTA